MGYIFIGLSIACSVALAQLLKWLEVKHLHRLRILSINYAVASFVALVQVSEDTAGQTEEIGVLFWAIAIFLGVGFILVFFVLSASIHANGMGVSIAAMRMSLLLPVLAGLFYYNESITTAKIIGIAGVLFSLVLLQPAAKNQKKQSVSAAWMIPFLFFLTGLNDLILKYVQESGIIYSGEMKFLGILFLVSACLGFLTLGFKKEIKFSTPELFLGILIGVTNLYSTAFLLRSLEYIEASVTFPTINISVVALTAVIGFAFWKDYLSLPQWVGIGLSILSIALLL